MTNRHQELTALHDAAQEVVSKGGAALDDVIDALAADAPGSHLHQRQRPQ